MQILVVERYHFPTKRQSLDDFHPPEDGWTGCNVWEYTSYCAIEATKASQLASVACTPHQRHLTVSMAFSCCVSLCVSCHHLGYVAWRRPAWFRENQPAPNLWISKSLPCQTTNLLSCVYCCGLMLLRFVRCDCLPPSH